MNIEDIKDGMRIATRRGGDIEEVLAVGNGAVFLRDENGLEWLAREGDLRDFSEVRTYPERWINVFLGANPTGFRDTISDEQHLADEELEFSHTGIARIHLATDGTLTLEDL